MCSTVGIQLSESKFNLCLTQAVTHDARSMKDCQKDKWKAWHMTAFRRANLNWPPVYTFDFQQVLANNLITAREAEFLHFLDRTCPVEQYATDDEDIDISQSLGRQSRQHCGALPCIVPCSRLWLRRRKRFLLAPEAIKAQGYDVQSLPCWHSSRAARS